MRISKYFTATALTLVLAANASAARLVGTGSLVTDALGLGVANDPVNILFDIDTDTPDLSPDPDFNIAPGAVDELTFSHPDGTWSFTGEDLSLEAFDSNSSSVPDRFLIQDSRSPILSILSTEGGPAGFRSLFLNNNIDRLFVPHDALPGVTLNDFVTLLENDPNIPDSEEVFGGDTIFRLGYAFDGASFNLGQVRMDPRSFQFAGVVPEPSSAALLGLAGVGLLGLRRPA